MSLADTGHPSSRPERVLNIGAGPRGQHSGGGNSLIPDAAALPEPVLQPDTAFTPELAPDALETSDDVVPVAQPEPDDTPPRGSRDDDVDDGDDDDGPGPTTPTTEPASTPTTRPTFQIPGDGRGPTTVGPQSPSKSHFHHEPRLPRSPRKPRWPSFGHSPHKPHGPQRPQAPLIPYKRSKPSEARHDDHDWNAQRESRESSPEFPIVPISPTVPHSDADRPKHEDKSDCHPHDEGERDMKRLGGAFERDDGDDGGVKHPREQAHGQDEDRTEEAS
jgi:hypothetical protein